MSVDPVVVATFAGPIAAVVITLWHQDRQRKYVAKERLFITLMAHRKVLPPAYDWVRALNLIDVVYSDHPKVIQAWHSFYDYIHVQPMDMKQFEHRNVELLTEMARVLGYKNLKQTDIDKFYSPVAHGEQAQMNAALQTELLSFLRALQKLAATSPIAGTATVVEGKSAERPSA